MTKYLVECLVNESVSCSSDIAMNKGKSSHLPIIAFNKAGQKYQFSGHKDYLPYARGMNGLIILGKVKVTEVNDINPAKTEENINQLEPTSVKPNKPTKKSKLTE